MFGLLGKNIAYTFSKEIHNELGYEYEIYDKDENEIVEILKNKDFKGLNVTIPYKEFVIKYLDEIDESAKSFNSVNTIINKNNKLIGYNTDYAGLKYMLEKNNVNVFNKKVLILGNGATAQMARVLVNDLECQKVVLMSRNSEVNFDSLAKFYDFEIIINTTPIGVYPNVFDSIINIDLFNNLLAFIDLTYNPLRSKLVLDAKNKDITAFGGLEMLVAQAVYSSEYFFDKTIDENEIERIYNKINKNKENIVLIGMPTAGKSTIGKVLAKALNREFFDVDELIVSDTNKSISDIFLEDGEDFFRFKESEIIHKLAALNNSVIASGGGSILDEKNIFNLKLNGKLVFINRPLELLVVSDDRPLSSNYHNLKKIYDKRIDLYKKYADLEIVNDKSIDSAKEEILELIK